MAKILRGETKPLRPEIKRLKQAFEDSELTTREFSRLARISRKQIYAILRGEAIPRTSTFEQMALVFGLRLDVQGIKKTA